MSDKEPIRPGAKGRVGAAQGQGARHDYAQTRFHAVQVLRHVPPPCSQIPQTPTSAAASSVPRASGSIASGVLGEISSRGWDEASLFDAAGERAMLSAADAAAAGEKKLSETQYDKSRECFITFTQLPAATAILASRNVEKERERREHEELRRERASKAALWLKKQQESKRLELALEAKSAGEQ